MDIKLNANDFIMNSRIQPNVGSKPGFGGLPEFSSSGTISFEEYYQQSLDARNKKIDAIVRVNGEIAAVLYENGVSVQYGLKVPGNISEMSGEARIEALNNWLRSSSFNASVSNYVGMDNQPTVKDFTTGKLFTAHDIALGWKGHALQTKAEIKASWEERSSFDQMLAKFQR